MKNPARLQALTGFEQMSLLPEPDFNPIKPKPNTLPARCLSQMLRGQHFTHPQFEQMTESWRLSAVVYDLREMGWPVESVDVPAPTKACPTRTISRYYLKPEAIEAVCRGAA